MMKIGKIGMIFGLLLALFIFTVSAEDFSYYLVELEKEFTQADLDHIFQFKVHGFLRSNFDIEGYYVISANPNQITKLSQAPHIGKIKDYYSLNILDPTISSTPNAADVVIIFFDDSNQNDLLNIIAKLDIDINEYYAYGLAASGNKGELRKLSNTKGIRLILNDDLHAEPNNLFAAQNHGGEYIHNVWNLYGAGQRFAVSDTGLGTTSCVSVSDCTNNNPSLHPDFTGRVRGIYDIAGCNAASCSTTVLDTDGHGTATAGRVAASGISSGSVPSSHSYQLSQAAISPEAELYIQDVMLDNGEINLPSIPNFIPVQYNPPYLDGVRIHTLGYGSDGTTGLGAYTSVDVMIDKFAFDMGDYLFTVGTANNGQTGIASTVGWPGTSKNGITVGQWAASTYFPAQANQVVTSSGIGPTLDGRIKPDVIASGQSITTRSTAGTYPPWPVNNLYTDTFAGTSGATPVAASTSALIREYLQVYENSLTPSAAVLKAVNINGAQDIGYGIPDSRSGWGVISLSDAIPDPMSAKSLYVWDNTQGISQGSTLSDTIDLNPGEDLRITLVWTDKESDLISTFNPTSPKLINNLDLEVVDPNMIVHVGNGFFNGGLPDTVNNVERVELPVPVAGQYGIRVRGTSVPMGPQPFAIAVTADQNDIPPSFLVPPQDVNLIDLTPLTGALTVNYLTTDPNQGDYPLTVSVVSAPSWLTITPGSPGPNSASLTGTPPDYGVYPVTMQVCDVSNVCTPTSFVVTINGINSISIGASTIGTTIPITLYAPQHANKPYIFGASWNHFTGIPLPDGRTIAVDDDDLFQLTLTGLYGLLTNHNGILDSTGQAVVNLNMPYIPALVGTTIYTGFVVLDGAQIPVVTMAEFPMTFQT